MEICLPFYLCGAGDEIFHNKETLDLKETFKFPIVSEKKRIAALHNSLTRNGYNAWTPDSTKQSHHFCQFSGGGDLYNTKEVSAPMVFVASEDSTVSENSLELSVPSASSEEPNDQISASPSTPGTSKLSALSIEAKRESVSVQKLKYQLWANMFCIAVTTFVESLSSFTKQDILQLQQVSGYGVGCSGDGILGVYKMEIKFGKRQNL